MEKVNDQAIRRNCLYRFRRVRDSLVLNITSAILLGWRAFFINKNDLAFSILPKKEVM